MGLCSSLILILFYTSVLVFSPRSDILNGCFIHNLMLPLFLTLCRNNFLRSPELKDQLQNLIGPRIAVDNICRCTLEKLRSSCSSRVVAGGGCSGRSRSWRGPFHPHPTLLKLLCTNLQLRNSQLTALILFLSQSCLPLTSSFSVVTTAVQRYVFPIPRDLETIR